MSDTLPSELVENCEPIFHTSPRTLLELTSIRLALHLWLEKFNRIYPNLKMNASAGITDSKYQPEIESLAEIPIAIGKIIESWIPVIVKELNVWYKTFITDVHRFNRDDIYSRIDLVVFGGNGTVHFKDTIRNFFKDDTLNNFTKFQIACVYCMEENIDIFWPLVCDTLCIDDMQFENNFLMYYWICRKRGELNRIPLQGFDCIEQLMIDKCSWHPNWLAIEYFLALLNGDDRFSQIDQLFENEAYSDLAKNLLPHFEITIQRRVVDLEPLQILYAFVKFHQLFDYAIQTWLHIRNFITHEQFYVDIIRELIRDRNYYYKSFGSRAFEISNYVFYESVLAEIWFHSPRHFKQFVLDFHFLDICLEMTNYRGDLLKNLSRDIGFVLAMLSDADIDLRKKFWDENWSKWIMGVPSAHLERLMDLCLTNAEAIDDFKKHLKESHLFAEYCDTLVARGYHNELNNFLSCLYGDEGEKLNIKMELLNTNKHWMRCIFKPHNVKQIQQCSGFIDIMLSNETLAKDFKNQFIMSEDNLNILYDKLDRKNFLDIEIVVETFLSSEKRGGMKEILLTKFRDMITSGELHKFDQSDCENFLMWCAQEDEQRVRNFVKLLPIEGIFEAAVSNCMKYESDARYGFSRFVRKCTLEDLNKFLAWYFESSSLSEAFKRERIQVYEGMTEAEIESIFGVDKDSVIEDMKKELLIFDVEGGDGN